MQVLENRMLIDSEWRFVEPVTVEREPQEAGYRNISTDEFVPDDEALDYALEHEAQEDMTDDEFVEWFYSGNWVRTSNE